MPVRMYIGKNLELNTTYKTELPRVQRAGTPLTKGLKKESAVNVSSYWRKHARDLRINTAIPIRADKVSDCRILLDRKGYRVRFDVV